MYKMIPSTYSKLESQIRYLSGGQFSGNWPFWLQKFCEYRAGRAFYFWSVGVESSKPGQSYSSSTRCLRFLIFQWRALSICRMIVYSQAVIMIWEISCLTAVGKEWDMLADLTKETLNWLINYDANWKVCADQKALAKCMPVQSLKLQSKFEAKTWMRELSAIYWSVAYVFRETRISWDLLFITTR